MLREEKEGYYTSTIKGGFPKEKNRITCYEGVSLLDFLSLCGWKSL